MTLDWSQERYARIYVRDTPDWLALGPKAQGLFCLLLRKVDRTGILPLGRQGRRGVAVALCAVSEWDEWIDAALATLEADGCVQVNDDGTKLLIPNYVAAQEARTHTNERSRQYRERRRDAVRAEIGVTKRDAASRNVTRTSRAVTRRHSVPSCTVRKEIAPPPPVVAAPAVSQPQPIPIESPPPSLPRVAPAAHGAAGAEQGREGGKKAASGKGGPADVLWQLVRERVLTEWPEARGWSRKPDGWARWVHVMLADHGREAFEYVVGRIIEDLRRGSLRRASPVTFMSASVYGQRLLEFDGARSAPQERGGRDVAEDAAAAVPWQEVLAQLASDGKHEAVRWLSPLPALELRDGVLVLGVPDELRRRWMTEEYGRFLDTMLARLAAPHGAEQVQFRVATCAAA